MAIAHVCPRCGIDLARKRPVREPHYNLPLVICRCGWAGVRRMHPIWRGWRYARRLFRASLAIALQATGVWLFLGLWTLAARHSAGLVDRYPIQVIYDDHRPFAVYVLIVLPVATGAWLRAAYGHWRFGLQWPAWGLLVAALFTLGQLGLPFVTQLDAANGPNLQAAVAAFKAHVPFWRSVMLVFAVMLLMSPLGWPLGRAIAIAYARRRVRRWSKRRKRLRRRAMST